MTETTPRDISPPSRSDVPPAGTSPDDLVPVEEMIEAGVQRLAEAVALNPNVEAATNTSIQAHLSTLRTAISEVFYNDDESTQADMLLMQLDKRVYLAQKVALGGTSERVIETLWEIFKQAIAAVTASISFTDHMENGRRACEFEREKLVSAAAGLDVMLTQSQVSATAQEVRRIADDVQEAAGDVAQSQLAAHYQEGAEAEGRRYLFWNLLFGGSVLASVALASFLIAQSPQSNWTAQEATRITLAIPLLAFAVHAARQSRFHRDAQASLSLVAIKLKTVRAFADSLEFENRQELLKMLGEAIFSAPGQSNATTEGADSLPISMPDLTELLRSRGTAQNNAGDSTR
ncbi:hypothetical protein [Micromonospora chersina]|uniref:hypothetical protein n=1 Tax=Micromonospora chersina TaxID=47854 RepID=UPI000B8347C1|nr:hypothetical protein [Micromonospora chersina]